MKQIWFLIFSGFFLIGCSPQEATEKPLVVCTTGMLADGVRQLLGPNYEVVALMGPGIDPHLYKATQGDLGRLRRAQAVVYNGLYLEGKMGDILEKLALTKPVYAIGSGIAASRLLVDPDNPSVPDPHIWFDLEIWKQGMDGVAAFLSQTFPNHQNEILNNARELHGQLTELHREVYETLHTLPEERRILVTAHDAFQYFGRAYGLEVESLQGISTASEYGLQDITRIVQLIVQQQVPAVFIESSVSPRAIRAVVEGSTKLGHPVQVGGELYSDALGPAGSGAETFEGTVRHNVKTILEGLKETHDYGTNE
jgi:manganese/zinc/iron transport system substrate-binding protein